jgi:heme/copper-type cytochrome/quinol oxidase subunit 2
MDLIIDPVVTVKAIGRQWYWQFEYEFQFESEVDDDNDNEYDDDNHYDTDDVDDNDNDYNYNYNNYVINYFYSVRDSYESYGNSIHELPIGGLHLAILSLTVFKS